MDWQIGFDLIAFLVIPLGYFVWRIHANHLSGICKRLDRIESEIRDVRKDLAAHVAWHLDSHKD